ncbi:hypothetical protein RRX38_02920 [Pseudomonas sp. DTU_2021_1001937_2_SI_NGA_ILE_001]|uniref:hypothetical protein n=1 Tax=Pseudomonas sp. DTU_2021_1001937_2_SI_NGA_ILE_001 TaxID=3077589 RepID=UPI0028FC2EAF|nr:hypothetical protein [Pseudomonas sp. DTU_2021_1001937_2_SI_NGA_ILE_001]WNW10142.1 hypothetical protein RRX38_02920 [Pseudomonas sp. DTU_2021_1001937_2_SI_NGA_ILE_001]
MWWVGPEKSRFKIQRRISCGVLALAIFFLAMQINAYCSGEALFTDVLGGVFLTALGGGMFYMADKW